MMFWYSNDSGYGNGWGYAAMVVGMLVFWALVIVGISLLLRRPHREAGGMVPAHRSAQQVLAERFARGEIDESEFTQRLTALHGPKKL
ncbi:SHOCT domain-containing protein [Rhodococcus antarcticus]|jgi:putative membrane protein|uniref:SHOCT domain-containing protein n=1 Tax=Rhodococcus antarcticus TaxID=2987751 RepID=A0ABY6P1C0_9NOCA|nr:SHOCT domain-containing protein [Rhodococcus antarcticus]UZJ25146.1 SHOCT domain-containing protein [Rhodococcus antarcticus]